MALSWVKAPRRGEKLLDTLNAASGAARLMAVKEWRLAAGMAATARRRHGAAGRRTRWRAGRRTTRWRATATMPATAGWRTTTAMPAARWRAAAGRRRVIVIAVMIVVMPAITENDGGAAIIAGRVIARRGVIAWRCIIAGRGVIARAIVASAVITRAIGTARKAGGQQQGGEYKFLHHITMLSAYHGEIEALFKQTPGTEIGVLPARFAIAQGRAIFRAHHAARGLQHGLRGGCVPLHGTAKAGVKICRALS